ncbi:hypothetical protein [Aquimarina muelleri]|uniref:Lipocalin-like domain-containing protein n=2 Tax=Aquimarina muelleri TaxID=279356 RepID=A0A918N1L2_9FLAO|nr:hypothetical protein [Aquimarina muelleri]GGX03462.1 hypothetical protein GCM10007384_01510 [Aquimarina muelleri]
MKKMKYFVYVLFLAIGCSEDDDTSLNSNLSGLQGEWSLANVTGGLIGINENFKKGMIIWVFNEETKTVKITNKNTNDVYDVLSSGTYTYSILVVNDSKELIIDDKNIGNFELTTNQFTIDDQFRDGFKVTFNR